MGKQKYRAVLIGAAHMHVLYLSQQCLENPRIELCGFADTDSFEALPDAPVFTRGWNTYFVTKRLGVPFFSDYRSMLDEIKPDLAIISTETPLHVEVFRECAQRGITASMEKPMAVNMSDGLTMARIAEQTGSELMVNWPLAWSPCIEQLRKVITGGRIGKLAKVNFMRGHSGPLGRGVKHPRINETADNLSGAEKSSTWWYSADRGGGAMLDYCCYGVMACNYLIDGKALAVSGMRCNSGSPWCDADDNAVMIVRYPDCIATLEGSWTVPAGVMNAAAPTLFGTEALVLNKNVESGVEITIRDYFGNVETLPVLSPKPHMTNITTAFVHHRDTEEPLPSFLNLYENLDVLAVLDAGIRSANSGKLESVETRAWHVG